LLKNSKVLVVFNIVIIKSAKKGIFVGEKITFPNFDVGPRPIKRLTVSLSLSCTVELAKAASIYDEPCEYPRKLRFLRPET
jgi:hypothetical protein